MCVEHSVLAYTGCVQLALGRTPVCPGCVRLALGRPRSAPSMFEYLWRHSRGSPGSAPSALLVAQVTWGWPQVHDITKRAVSDSSFSSSDAHPGEHRWVDTGKLFECPLSKLPQP